MQSPVSRKAEAKFSAAARKLKHVLDTKLPVLSEGLKDVLKTIKACSTEELAALGLAPPPLPAVNPAALCKLPLAERLQAVQDIISSLQYNHTSGYYFNVSKQRPLPAILATAASILRDPLPIKCIEAVFLGLLLTQGWGEGLQRIPVGFKSTGANGQVYRHIVLAVCDSSGSGLFGALGLSRRSNLMYKPLVYTSLAELVEDYQAAYSGWCHQLVKVRVGLPVEHDSTCMGPVCWRYCTVSPMKRSRESIAAILNAHAAAAAKLQGKFKAAAAAAASAATSNSGSGSSPSPHITRPHASTGAVYPPAGSSSRSSTPVLSNVSPRRSFGASQQVVQPASSPTVAGHSSSSIFKAGSPNSLHTRGHGQAQMEGPAAASAGAGKSTLLDRHVSNGCASLAAAAAWAGDCSTLSHSQVEAGGFWQQQRQTQQQVCLPVSVCDDSSSEEEAYAYDSDSEVNVIVDTIRHSPRHVHVCNTQV